MTKGEYLKGKLQNMARWVTQEVGAQDLPVDVIAGIAGRSDLECTVLASTVQSNKVLVEQKNWAALGNLLEYQELQQVLTIINQRPQMHDKFWRYMQLMIDVIEQ